MEEEYQPITKDSLIKGYLTLYNTGGMPDKVFIMSIQKVAEDKRIEWESNLIP